MSIWVKFKFLLTNAKGVDIFGFLGIKKKSPEFVLSVKVHTGIDPKRI
jgi:hypothetical protein